MSISAFGDGLDLTNPDSFAPEEEVRFREFYVRVKGGLPPAHEFLLVHRPDLLKRHRAQAREMTDLANEKYPLVHTLAHLHHYAIRGFETGIAYEVKQARAGGASAADVLDTLGIAYLHAGPMGMHSVAMAIPAFEPWAEAAPRRFPDHWVVDHQAFACGLDYTTPEVLAGELEAVLGWYQQTLGEVPGYVSLLVERPRVLKAYRNRLEHTIRGTLPKQAFPYFQLHHAVCLGAANGIREAILLGRAFGLRRSEIFDAVCWGLYYGGPSALSSVEQAAGDLLGTYEK